MRGRSRHRAALPPWHTPRQVVLTEDYQSEVDAAAARLQAEHRRARKRSEAAQRRVERTERRAAAAPTSGALRRAGEAARRAAEQAWLEFQRLDAMVRERPLSSNKNGQVRRVGVAGAGRDHLAPADISDRLKASSRSSDRGDT